MKIHQMKYEINNDNEMTKDRRKNVTMKKNKNYENKNLIYDSIKSKIK